MPAQILPVLLLLLITVPLMELWVLIQVGSELGAGLTVALVLLTAVAGVALIRRQGLDVLINARLRLMEGVPPTLELVEGLVLAVCGLCLLVPGFLTDLVGFLGLIPTLRRRLIWRLIAGLPGPPVAGGRRPTIIEGTARGEDDPAGRP